MSKEAKLARLYTRLAYCHLVACRELQAKLSELSGSGSAIIIAVAIDAAIAELRAKNPNWEAALKLEEDLAG